MSVFHDDEAMAVCFRVMIGCVGLSSVAVGKVESRFLSSEPHLNSVPPLSQVR